jgi:tetratricopeptide (TPR) repeat protein
LCFSFFLHAAPKREGGLSVHLSPERTPEIFGVDKKGFIVSQSKDLKPVKERPLFDTPEELIKYFLNQPQDIQKNGIWVVTTNPQAYSKLEIGSTETLKKLCREKNIKLFFCRASVLPSGWLPADKFSLKDSNKYLKNVSKANERKKQIKVYLSNGEYDKAIEVYSEALKTASNPAYVIHDRGMVYAQMGRFEKAIMDFSKAIEINPNEKKFIAQCYNDRGIAYFQSGQLEKSWEDVQKALNMGYNVHPGFLAALKNEGYSK